MSKLISILFCNFPVHDSNLFSCLSFPRQSYDIEVELEVTGTNLKSTSTYDLKNTHLRYMNASSPAYTVHNKDPTNSYLKNQPNKSSDVSPDSNSDSSKTQGMVQTPSYLPAPVLVPNFF